MGLVKLIRRVWNSNRGTERLAPPVDKSRVWSDARALIAHSRFSLSIPAHRRSGDTGMETVGFPVSAKQYDRDGGRARD